MGQLEDRRSLSMTVLMTPDMANFAGKVHGGTLLKFLDQVAYSCASRYAGAYAVTLSVDRVLFRDAILVDVQAGGFGRVVVRGNVDPELAGGSGEDLAVFVRELEHLSLGGSLIGRRGLCS